MIDEQAEQNTEERQGRLDRLSKSGSSATYNKKYSVFIRWMRLVLPMVAVAIMAVVFTWTTGKEEIADIAKEVALPTIGKNELLNPKFESRDDKKQPYTIIAKRAIQGETNDDLVILEEPLADMLLKSGSWLAVKAEQGAFRQDNKRLLLKGNVELYHDDGYQMNMSLLNVDMAANTAWTDVDVEGHGPEGTIEAKGLEADSEKGLLIFNGPAKLVLTKGSGLGEAFGG